MPDEFDETSDDHRPALTLAPDAVEVRRNAGLAALVGGLASAVAIAYLARASATGAVLDWVLAGVLAAARDRLPGRAGRRPDAAAGGRRPGRPDPARPRLARAAVGCAAAGSSTRRAAGCCATAGWSWSCATRPALVEELDRGGRRQSRLSQRLYGAPFAVPAGPVDPRHGVPATT